MFAFSSCAVTNPKLKTDVIGFSEDATISYNLDRKNPIKPWRKQDAPYNLLTGDRGQMETFVYQLPQGKNTAGFYALDLALDRVKYVRKKRDIMGWDLGSKYFIITLTDGLDNASIQTAKNRHQGNYKTTEDYVAKIQKKMAKVTKNPFINLGKPCDFTAYCLAYKGKDLREVQHNNNMSDADFEAYIKKQLSGFTGASEGLEKPDVIFGSDFSQMFEDFVNQFQEASFEFLVPKSYINKRIKMTLWDSKHNKIVIEGDYQKGALGKYAFTNLSYSNGVTCEEEQGSTLKSQNKDRKDISSRFSINAIKYNGKPFRVAYCMQEYYDGGLLMKNSEYDGMSDLTKNAYIIVVLDGSESFRNEAKEAKNMIFKIIDEITK